MLEAEIKLAIDADAARALEARLKALGASPLAPVEQHDIYFAHPARDFATTDEALRLRQDAGGLRVTYKGPKLDPPRKTREEIEFPVGTDLETARTLLERLGFIPVASVEKSRREFVLEGPPRAVISIDELPDLGTFCEIEAEAESVAEGRDALDGLAIRLGLADRPPIAESYLELLLRARR